MRDGAFAPGHVLACRDFGLLFVGFIDAGGGDQGLVVIPDLRADHYLELTGVGEAAFDHRQLFDFFRFGQSWVIENKTQPGNAVANGSDILAPAHQHNQAIDILLFYFAHY
ncbi:hypothetical protein D3C78_1565060 [compost metagenome]